MVLWPSDLYEPSDWLPLIGLIVPKGNTIGQLDQWPPDFTDDPTD
jgi:hypothetical protein